MEPNNYNPTQTPPLQPAPHSKKRTRIIIALAIVGILLLWAIMLTVIIHVVTGRTTDFKTDKNYSSSNFKDWLAPSSEIKVGSYRYVSPCQALTAKNIANTFGSYANDGYITETFLDYSVTPKSDKLVDTNCSYSIRNKAIRTVGLTAKQFTDINDARNLSRSMSLRSDDVNQAVARYKKAADAAGTPDVKAFVANIEKSAKTYQQNLGASGDENPDVSFDGMTLPDTQSELGHEFKIQTMYKNVVYELSVGLAGGPTKSLDYSDKQIAAILAGFSETLKTLKQNVNNPKLSQSPSATILGKSEKVGPTRILEPCAVMPDSLFKSFTGLDQNQPVDRSSVIFASEKESTTKSGFPTLPTNTCKRSFSDIKDTDGLSAAKWTAATLGLSYASSDARAQKTAQETLGTTGENIDLQTDADWARSLPFGEDGRIYIFRVGAYVGTIKISIDSSEGLGYEIITTQADQAAHVKAINELVKSIKQQK